MSEDEAAFAFLTEATRVARLATVSAGGDPHVVPVWFAVDGRRLLVHSLADSRKVRNIRATGKYALTVDKDDPPYKGVTVGGRAEAVGEESEDWRALIRSLAVRYLGPDVGAGYGEFLASMPGEHVTLVLHVDRTEAWDHS